MQTGHCHACICSASLESSSWRHFFALHSFLHDSYSIFYIVTQVVHTSKCEMYVINGWNFTNGYEQLKLFFFSRFGRIASSREMMTVVFGTRFKYIRKCLQSKLWTELNRIVCNKWLLVEEQEVVVVFFLRSLQVKLTSWSENKKQKKKKKWIPNQFNKRICTEFDAEKWHRFFFYNNIISMALFCVRVRVSCDVHHSEIIKSKIEIDADGLAF